MSTLYKLRNLSEEEILTAQHACRDSGVILLASGGAGLELLQIWG